MMEELIRGLRGELINCRCCAHSRSECCCDCTWPEDVARQAADMLETQAAKIQQMALEYISEQGQWIDETGRLRDEIAKLKALCDQLGAVLLRCTPLDREADADYYEAIDAWREMEGGCDETSIST